MMHIIGTSWDVSGQALIQPLAAGHCLRYLPLEPPGGPQGGRSFDKSASLANVISRSSLWKAEKNMLLLRRRPAVFLAGS